MLCSCVEGEAETAVLGAIRNSSWNPTVVIITHKVSQAGSCSGKVDSPSPFPLKLSIIDRERDNIIVLQGGVVAESGGYAGLMARNGVFAGLVNRNNA